ncbi:hypothetical protein SALBM311S_09353 [Streptomyces alboniger]
MVGVWRESRWAGLAGQRPGAEGTPPDSTRPDPARPPKASPPPLAPPNTRPGCRARDRIGTCPGPRCPPRWSRPPGLAPGAGFYRAFTGGHALFPSGTVGWSLAVLTGVIVGHLVALGRARWWRLRRRPHPRRPAVVRLGVGRPGQPDRGPAGRCGPPAPLATGGTARWTPPASPQVPCCSVRSAGCRPSSAPGTPTPGRSTPPPKSCWSRSPISRSPASWAGISTPRAPAVCRPSRAPPWSDRAWSPSRCSASRP